MPGSCHCSASADSWLCEQSRTKMPQICSDFLATRGESRENPCLICFHSEKPKVRTAFGMIMDDHFLSMSPFCSAPSDTVHPMTKVARKALRWRQDMSRKWANWPKIFQWKIWKRLRWDADGCWGCRSGGSKCAGA